MSIECHNNSLHALDLIKTSHKQGTTYHMSVCCNGLHLPLWFWPKVPHWPSFTSSSSNASNNSCSFAHVLLPRPFCYHSPWQPVEKETQIIHTLCQLQESPISVPIISCMVFRILHSATMAASQFAPRTIKTTESIITKFQNRKTQDTISLWNSLAPEYMHAPRRQQNPKSYKLLFHQASKTLNSSDTHSDNKPPTTAKFFKPYFSNYWTCKEE